MASITAVELGADACALAQTSVRRGDISVSAVETLDPASFPGLDALTVAVRRCRQMLKLPRRCRVVLWGLPEGANRRDAAVKPLLAPLVGAGFRIDRVVSPCDALAALARVKTSRGAGATCWLAINRGGVAIVVVRPGKQLYAHSFVWDSNVGASGSQARLLQRYSLVSYLSPEVKRALAEARRQGTPVDAVVTCGNLPDLRSLTMPLIEELDVEVETLDSLDGLVVAPAATERLAEVASAIRLACAGAVARGTRPWDESKRRAAHRTDALLRVAAVLAIVAIGAFAYSWYERWRAGGPAASAAAAPVAQTMPRPTNPPRTEPRAPDVGPRASDVGPRAPDVGPRASDVGPRASDVGPRTSGVGPRLDRPVSMPPAPIPTAPPTGVNPVPTATDKPVASPAVSGGSVAPASPEPDSNRPVVSGAGTGPEPSRTMPALLRDPVPRVTAILVSNERRFATVNEGQIVGIGDVIGKRIVVAIDDRAVVLREPSGVQIRVGLGGRILGIEAGR